MNRRILTASLLGLFGALFVADPAEACSRGGRGGDGGGTYHYNGSMGYWTGGVSATAALSAPASAQPINPHAPAATYAMPQAAPAQPSMQPRFVYPR